MGGGVTGRRPPQYTAAIAPRWRSDDPRGPTRGTCIPMEDDRDMDATATAPDTRRHVLVVEDTPRIADLVVTTLGFEGYRAEAVGDGAAALARIRGCRPDLVVLDVMLPGMDGFEVQRRLSSQPDAPPVLFLTARDGTLDRVRGLDLGAEDYLVKPFAIEELVARVRAILRRAEARAEPPADVIAATLRAGDIELDPQRRTVVRSGTTVELTQREFDLLQYLLEHPGVVLSKARLLDAVWKYDFGGNANVVEQYVSYLRRKLDAPGETLIRTVRGVGYVIREPGTAG